MLSAHQELVGPITAAELREAIEQPAFLVGCEPEPGLTERLLADVEGQPGALPLLQFALTEVWKKRDVRRLTLRAYTELGKDDKGEQRGIEGVLDHRANEIYRNLTPVDQDLCRRLFLRLVQPGEETEDTKRRVSYRELLPDNPARAEAVWNLVQTLASRDARLITTEGTDATEGAVEVAHEALIRGWTQLRKWVDAERTGLRIHRRLTEDAKEWEDARPEAKEDFLYSGVRLAVCREWVATHRDELNPIEGAFLAASEEAERQREHDALENERRLREAAEAAREAERERAEEAEARRRAELERADAEARRAEEARAREREAEARKQDAVAAAEWQRQLGLRFLVAAIVAGVLAVTSGGLALWANNARQLATAQAQIAESRRLVSLSDLARPERLDLAMLLALEAAKKRDILEARGSLQRSRRASGSRSLPPRPRGRCHEPGLRAGGPDRRGIWRRRRGALRRPVRAARTRAAEGRRCHERGLRAGGPDRRGIWRPRRRRGALQHPGRAAPPAPLKVKEGPVSSVAFGPEGQITAGYGVFDRGGGFRGGGVVLFDADPASWLRKAGQTANRNFTRLEWTRYFPETSYRRTIRSLPWPHDLPEDERKQAEAFEKEHPEGSDAS